jgi:hypothetical protein
MVSRRKRWVAYETDKGPGWERRSYFSGSNGFGGRGWVSWPSGGQRFDTRTEALKHVRGGPGAGAEVAPGPVCDYCRDQRTPALYEGDVKRSPLVANVCEEHRGKLTKASIRVLAE